jgi:drug/metabolite transporter (DMT)-like permease
MPDIAMSDNLRGILWMLLATALTSIVAALAKSAVMEYHILQILFFRQVFVFLSALPGLKKTFPHSLRTKAPFTHALRVIGSFVALFGSVWAVAVLPLTTAITLGFSQVLFLSVLALVFLKEPVGRHRITAVIIGFVGVIIVMRPGVDGFANLYTLIPIAGAFGGAVAFSCVRKLSQTESTETILAYQAIFVGLVAGVSLFWLWKTPDFDGWVLLIGMGVVATAANWVGVKALRLGEASVVGNIEYMKLIYATILGYFIFSEIPDGYTLAGASVIVVASVYIFHRERAQRPQS